ncbi:MAG: hypothetical protein ACOCZB_06410 [Spirochaetota bacterium]
MASLAPLLAGACGIPQFVFLAPPELGGVNSLPPTVSFSHDEINDIDSFRGYELYYKFYDPNAGDVATAFSADRAAIEAAPPGSVVSTLVARDYLRVYAAGSNAPPALAIRTDERDEPFTVSVVFPDGATIDEAAAAWNTEGPRTVVLLRDQGELGDPTEPVGFAPSDITAADADTPATLPAGGTVEMGLAVAAYGIDYITGTFAELYSTAVVADQLLGVSYQ